ncbi:MAG TPA: BldC family transcriptional regulator [Trebonia sp.]
MLIPAPGPGHATSADELLTRGEVARLFRVDPKTVTKWAQAGKLRTIRTLGGHRRFYASDIRTYLRNTKPAPAAKDRR